MTTPHQLAEVKRGGYTFTAHADLDEDMNVINQYTRCTPEGRAMAAEKHGDEAWSIAEACVMNHCTSSHWRVQSDLLALAAIKLDNLIIQKNEENIEQQESPFGKEYEPSK